MMTAQHTTGSCRAFGRFGVRRSELRQDDSDPLQICGTDLGQAHLAGRPREEAHAQPSFQRLYPAGQDRGILAQHRGRGDEAAMLGNSGKRADLIELTTGNSMRAMH
jgi:hypothetical protein